MTGDESNSRPLFTSSHYPHERWLHDLFVGKSIFDINKWFLLIDFVGCHDYLWRMCQSNHRRWLDWSLCRSVVARKISFQKKKKKMSNCHAGNESHLTQPQQPPSEPDLNKQQGLLLTQFLWLYSKEMWLFLFKIHNSHIPLCLLQSSSINYFLNIIWNQMVKHSSLQIIPQVYSD